MSRLLHPAARQMEPTAASLMLMAIVGRGWSGKELGCVDVLVTVSLGSTTQLRSLVGQRKMLA